MAKEPATLQDIADALGTSIGTVHRALHGNPGVSPKTKAKVLETAKALGYRPNLAARYLSSKHTLRVSIITLRGSTSFWNEVRAGIREEASFHAVENIELDFRTYRRIGDGEEQGFNAAVRDNVSGIIIFPSSPKRLKPLILRANASGIPVVCVATDAPESDRRGVVAVDTLVSGSIAADLMGRFLGGRQGSVAVTLFDRAITEHEEKYTAFQTTLQSLYPELNVLKPIEDHGIRDEALKMFRATLAKNRDLVGVYVTTEASIPVLKAAREAKLIDNLTIITTDLFPELVPEIRKGAVAATIYQRPRTQGQMALRMLYRFMVERNGDPEKLALAPHVVMRGNLDFFMRRQSQESLKPTAPASEDSAREFTAEYV